MSLTARMLYLILAGKAQIILVNESYAVIKLSTV